MHDTPNILVVCGRNKRRSRTAEYLFRNEQRFRVRSAGLSAQSPVVLNAKLIEWSHLVLVMDNEQRNRIRQQYRSLSLPDIENLDIPDEFEFNAPELVEILQARMKEILDTHFSI